MQVVEASCQSLATEGSCSPGEHVMESEINFPCSFDPKVTQSRIIFTSCRHVILSVLKKNEVANEKKLKDFQKSVRISKLLGRKDIQRRIAQCCPSP